MEFQVQSSYGYVPAKCINIDEMLYAPVLAGYWKQCQTWDGTYTLDDLLDITEAMLVKNENERREQEYMEQEREVRKNVSF